MNSKKSIRILSLLLALTVFICGFPFTATAAESATDGATCDYTTFATAEKLQIEYYYSTLKMHDGVGLEVEKDTGIGNLIL